MNFTPEGKQLLVKLIDWEVEERHGGSLSDFCCWVSERLEERFFSQYGRSSPLKLKNRSWFSESAFLRWRNTEVLSKRIFLLHYLANAKALRDPLFPRVLTIDDITDILLGTLVIRFPNNKKKRNSF